LLAREERAEAEARSGLGACLRARDAVRNLQARRRLQERELTTRREQHALDDLAACRLFDASTTAQGSRQKSRLLLAATELMSEKAQQATFSNELDAIRAMASKSANSFPPGEQNGR
jgi:hypothetical protein